MAPKTDPHKVVEQLSDLVAGIFDQAQDSVANHKKNCVAMYKLHAISAEVVETTGKKGKDLRRTGEEKFQDAFLDMVNRVLVMKRGLAHADRCVKYVGAVVRYMNEKVNEAITARANDENVTVPGQNASDPADEDNATTRFVSRILNYLLQGLLAKNKIVRFRSIYFISEMISHLGEIDEDTYTELKNRVIGRLSDKETYVRAHAVIALSKLVGTDDEEDLEDGEHTILQTLLDVVAHDPAAEVRRAALINVPLTHNTIGAILSRTRDLDPVTRKLVYAAVLPSKLSHPRQLSIAQRELVVKDGLGDREPGVRVAAGKLVTTWFDGICAEKAEDEEHGWEGDDGGIMKGLVRFLSLFDVVGPGEAVAVDAILAVFSTRPETCDVFIFSDNYWKNLTPESALVARTFVDYCMTSKSEARLESASIPVITAFAFHIQEVYNQLLEVVQEMETARMLRDDEDENEDVDALEEELGKKEVILNELLKITLNLDYGDEIGRRKLFSVVRDMLAHPQLPYGIIDRCLDVLKEIMPSERDLIRLIVEIIVELREGDEPDGDHQDEPPIPDDASDGTVLREKSARKAKSADDVTPEQRIKADLTDLRCLMLSIAVLERVNGSFEDNSTLEGILGDLIIPSVKRKEMAMREKALVSLGLCCLIAKNMALSSFQLFMSQAQNAPPDLKLQVFKVVLDLLIMYPQEFFGRNDDISKRISDFLLHTLETEESPEAQAILCTGICKLLLAGIVTDTRLLTCLALLYVSPATIENQHIRQCLSYFFPVYAYSAPANQTRVEAVFVPAFDLAVRMYEDLDEDQEMITPYQFGLLMVDWTNPAKSSSAASNAAAVNDKKLDTSVHAQLAVDILIALYDSDRSAEEQKTLCQVFGQLVIEPGLETRLIHKLNVLLSNHEEQCPFENPVIDKLFDKFKKKILTMFSDQIKDIDPHQYVDDDFRDLYQKIGVDVPGEDDGGKSKRKVKRRKQSDDEEEEEEEEEEEDENADENEGSDKSAPPSPQPAPSKRATGRKPSRPTRASSKPEKERSKSAESSDEEGSSDEENIPPESIPARSVTPTKKNGVKRMHTPSAGMNSPANRKKTRTKAPPKLGLESLSPLTTDDESPPTPTRTVSKPKAASKRAPAAPATGKTGSKKSTSRRKLSPQLSEVSEQVEDDDADEVASTLAVSPAASSDDFGGYSD